MKYIPLDKLNQTIFGEAPIRMAKLQRWCRKGSLPARKFGSTWYVDLEAFGGVQPTEIPDIADHVRRAIETLRSKR